jgi:4-amino-4-deoxy-L-arabinose transferase-like glycosyltransferase
VFRSSALTKLSTFPDQHRPVSIVSNENSGPDNALFVPERSRQERYIALALFALSFLYLCIFRRFTAMEPDEGIVLQGAQRILHGQVLYRDFFSFLTPGSFYLQAALFKIFGNSFLVPRTALAVMGAVFSVIGYLLARRVCTRSAALLAVALLTLTTLPYRFLTLHNWDSTLFACLAVYCAVRMLELCRRGWLFALGSFASLSVLFEQSKGVGLCLGLGLGFVALRLSNQFRLTRTDLTYLAAGLAWPFLITFAYFFSQHAFSAMLADWLWPLQHYSTANRVRYGYANWSDDTRRRLWETGSWEIRLFSLFVVSPTFLVPVLPLAAIALFLYWTHRSIRKQAATDRAAYYCVVTGALAGLLLSIVAARADIIHFMYLQPLYGLLLAWIFDGRDIPGRWFRAVQPLLSAFLVLAFFAFAMPLLLRAVNIPYKVKTRRGVITMPAQDTVLAYAQERVAPGSTMLVYPYLPLYNYFTATFSPTAYDFFQPGMNTAEQGRVILDELKSGRVRVVLFEPSFPQKIASSWPGTPLSAIVQDPVADYIVEHYHSCKTLESPEHWRFLFMIRGDLECP